MVESEGFSFCVPGHWKIDKQFRTVEAMRRLPQFRTLAWGAPDSTARLLIDLPNAPEVSTSLKLALVNCRFNPLTGAESVVGDQTVCAQFKAPLGSFSVPDLTVVFPEPLMRIRVFGAAAFIVTETVRPLGKAATETR